MKKLQVNVITTINSASNISSQIIDGDDHYVIKNVVPLVADVVMNGGLYPADEIKASYAGLNDNPAPYDHPQVDGAYVSAHNVRAVNQYHVGSWIENSSYTGDRVLVDLKINKTVAERSEKGAELLKRIAELESNSDGAEPIHVSTGLLLNRESAEGKSKGKKYSWIARNMEWDHLAILPPGVPGAATPDNGVGIFATNAGDVERITVNLSESLEPDAEVTDHLKRSFLSKLVKFAMNKSELSFDNITDQLRREVKLITGEDSWPYIVAVYDDRFGFEVDNQLYQQFYTIVENKVQLLGERVKAVYKTELEPVKLTQEDLSMNADEIKAVLLETLSPVHAKLDAVNTELALVKSQNADLQAKLNAGAEQEETVMRAAILADLKLPESAVNALTGDALRETYAMTTKAPSLKGGLSTNKDADDISTMEAPE